MGVLTLEQWNKDMEYIRDTSDVCEQSKKFQPTFIALYMKHGKSEYLESAELESKIQKKYCG